MGDGDLIPLKCAQGTLIALSTSLTEFGPAAGCPDWLIAGAWLCVSGLDFFATSFVDVLADGYVSRPLCIDRPEGIAAQIEAELPDIQGRLAARGSNLRLQDSVPSLTPPPTLERWPDAPYSMTILFRIARTAEATHRIACALLFKSEEPRTFLVGTDKSTLAMVVSEESELIDRYRSGCEEVSLTDYWALFDR
jgi:hypothetical protein